MTPAVLQLELVNGNMMHHTFTFKLGVSKNLWLRKQGRGAEESLAQTVGRGVSLAPRS